MWMRRQRAELAFDPKTRGTSSGSRVHASKQPHYCIPKGEEDLGNSKPYIPGASSWLSQEQKCCRDVY